MKRQLSLLNTGLIVALWSVATSANAQVAFEFDFSEFDLDTPPADLDRYIVEDDLIAFFDYEFGLDLESGDVDPVNGVEAYNFNFMGCLEQWDGVESTKVEPVDCFWHGYGPEQCQPQFRMFDLTDGTGFFGAVMRDFARAANVIRVDFEQPTDIGSLVVWTEDNSRGIRVFQNYDVYYSTDNSLTGMTLLANSVRNGEFGITTNNAETLNANSSFTNVYDCSGAPLATGVTNLRLVFYCVGYDAGDLFVDPWRGYWHPDNSAAWNDCENQYPTDPQDLDGRQKPFVAPVIAEIDVLAPAPANAPGDVDGDGMVDDTDLAALFTYFDGPDGDPLPSAAIPLDFATKDCDVDLADVAGFQTAFGA